jgi:hypothetical protein
MMEEEKMSLYKSSNVYRMFSQFAGSGSFTLFKLILLMVAVLGVLLTSSLLYASPPGKMPTKICEGKYNVPYIVDATSVDQILDIIAKSEKVVVIIRADWCSSCCEYKEIFRISAENFHDFNGKIVFVNAEWTTLGVTFEDTSQMDILVKLLGTNRFSTMGFFVNGKHHASVWGLGLTMEETAGLFFGFSKLTVEELEMFKFRNPSKTE